jgi:hypothetical protein
MQELIQLQATRDHVSGSRLPAEADSRFCLVRFRFWSVAIFAALAVFFVVPREVSTTSKAVKITALQTQQQSKAAKIAALQKSKPDQATS